MRIAALATNAQTAWKDPILVFTSPPPISIFSACFDVESIGELSGRFRARNCYLSFSRKPITQILDQAEGWMDEDVPGIAELIDAMKKLMNQRSHSGPYGDQPSPTDAALEINIRME
jgi:hypothetical protein